LAGKKFSVLKHVLVPEHILLSREEARRILKKMGIKPSQLPWMLASDPVAVELGAKPGDIVMIIRDSPTAGKAIAFRLVIAG